MDGFIEYFTKMYGQLEWGTNYILTNVVFSICVVLVFNTLPYNKAKGIVLKIADLLGTYAVHTLISALSFMIQNYSYLNFVPWFIVIFAHAFLFNKMNIFDRLIKAMTFLTLQQLQLSICSFIGMIFGLWDADIFFVVAFASVMVFILKYFSTTELTKINTPAFISETILFATIVITSLVSEAYKTSETTISEMISSLLIKLCLYIVTLVSYSLYYWVNKQYDKAIEAQALYFKGSNDYQIAQVTKDNIDELRKMRHDMKNHYNYMKILLINKDYDKLTQFFSDLEEDSFVPLDFIDCGNKTISGVLNMERKKAENNHYRINHSILVPRNLSISDYDVCRLLTNIIDNAIEGSQRDGIENAIIEFRLLFRDNNLVIVVKNPIKENGNKEERITRKTSKEDKNLHGYGRKIIQEIIDKYDGFIKYEIKDAVFETSAMIKCHEVKEEVQNH